MKYFYYNANPKGLFTEDCTCRSISVAEGITWEECHKKLSDLSRQYGVILNDVDFIEDYLDKNLPMFDYRKMLQDVNSQYLYLGVNSIAVQCDGEGEAWNLVCCACVEIQKDNSFYDWHNH